jgi:hypothetical protein
MRVVMQTWFCPYFSAILAGHLHLVGVDDAAGNAQAHHEEALLELVIDARPLEHADVVRGEVLERARGDVVLEIEIGIDGQLIALDLC